MQLKACGSILLAAICCAGAGSTGAQTPTAADTASKTQDMRAQLAARFAAADANHDGKLTRDEAEGRMPVVAANFEQIDKAHRGYVTQADIQVFMREHMVERRQSSR